MIDCSDMFKPAHGALPRPPKKGISLAKALSLEVDDENVEPNQQANTVRDKSNVVKESASSVREPALEKGEGDEDTQTWVIDSLREMSLDFKAENLSDKDTIFKVLHGLIVEKNRWQAHCASLAEENSKINHQNIMSQKEHERDLNVINTLRGEVAAANNKVAAVMVEQREVKAHWLAEKSELESRVFQSQALATQWQGSLRKKEKDYDKLQMQLSKLIKESTRGQKDAVAKIVVSKPLAKNLTQVVKPTTTLKDAEVAAAQETIAMLERENLTFRKAVDDLTVSINDLKDKFASDLEKLEAQRMLDLEKMNELSAKAAVAKTEEEEEQQQQQHETLPVKAKTVVVASPQESSTFNPSSTPISSVSPPLPPTMMEAEAAALVSESLKKQCRTTPFRSPANGLAQSFLEGTPVARPAAWVVDQVNTEIKKLRNRADDIAGTRSQGVVGNNAGDAGKYEAMRAQLVEALAVIHEQDRLIHEALLGRLPGRILEFVSSENKTTENLWEDEDLEDEEEESKIKAGKTPGSSISDVSVSPFPGCDDDDIFPAASPATMELVKGWFKNTPKK